MAHVDALSRNPISNDDDFDSVKQDSRVWVISNNDWLHTLQLGDSELNRIRQILDSDLSSKEL
jgi:hypothetical protein